MCAHRPKKDYTGWHNPPLAVDYQLPEDEVVTITPRSAPVPSMGSARLASPALLQSPASVRGSINTREQIIDDEEEESSEEEDVPESVPPMAPPASPAGGYSSLGASSPRAERDLQFENEYEFFESNFCESNFRPVGKDGKTPVAVPAKREFRVLVAGLQGSGKSTLVLHAEKQTEIS